MSSDAAETAASSRGPVRSEPPRPAAPASMWSLLRNIEYRALVITHLLSLAGDQVAGVSLSVLVFNRTGSAIQSATAYALTFVPAVIGGPLLSGLVDRRPRRTVMIACDLVRVPLIALIAIPGIPIAAALVLVALAGLFEAPFVAARGALLPEVLRGDRYTKGYALTQVTQQVAQVGGFGLAGLLLIWFSPRTLLTLDAISFLFSAWLLWKALAPRPATLSPGHDGSARWWTHALADAKLSARVVFGTGTLRPLVLAAWSASTFAVSFESLGPPLARASNSATWTVGFLVACQPLGATVGAILAARTPEASRERVMRWLSVLSVAPMLLGLLQPGLATLALAAGLSGLGLSFNVLAVTLFVTRSQPEMRGRLLGLVGTGLLVAQGLGVFAAGALATAIDARLALGYLGIVAVAAVAVSAWDSWRQPGPEALPD